METPITVEFGEWLIFHRFPGWREASRFAAWVEAEYGRKVISTEQAEAAHTMTLFPYELEPPVVLVARDAGWTLEAEIESSVSRFGGQSAGT